jgi:hypothetical protein
MFISRFNSDDIRDKIEAYEDVIATKLPNQLKEFILKYNGGLTPNTSFNANGISSDIKAMYGLGNVEYSMDSIVPIDFGGKRFLPIGCDSFGNEIVMEITTGEVLFRDHENGKVTKIFNDLKTFFADCESKGIKPSSVKSVEEREADLVKRGRGSIITDELRAMWRAEIEKNSSVNLEEISI